jgi:hypothetical protein
MTMKDKESAERIKNKYTRRKWRENNEEER